MGELRAIRDTGAGVLPAPLPLTPTELLPIAAMRRQA